MKTLGGSDKEFGYSVIEASDGGLVVEALTYSFGAGNGDLLLAKFDAVGNHIWTRALGGSNFEEAYSLTQASDGGFVVTGWTGSFGAGGQDILLTKFDSSGTHLWTKTLGGGAYWDYGMSVIETPDSGLLVMGSIDGIGAGSHDILLAKFDAYGNFLWAKAIRGTNKDNGHCIIQSSDGGFVVTGWTRSFGAGTRDLFLMKFDPSANLLWARSLGGNDLDCGVQVIESSSGELVVTGYTENFGAGGHDLILTNCDASGNFLWTKTIGGADSDDGISMVQASDGGFILTGSTSSFGAGQSDILITKFDASWIHLWTRVLGGDGLDYGRSVIKTSDGRFVVTGSIESFGAGAGDFLIAKFYTSGNTCLGEFVNPQVDSVSPDTGTFDPTVIDIIPDTATWDPTITPLTPPVTVVCDDRAPTILSITDVGNDQGRQARVEWYRCYFDSAGSPVTITEYSLWRRIGEDKLNGQSDEMWLSDEEMFGGTRVYPPGDWDFIKTVPARGESTYNTVCPTLGDSTEAEGMYWSVFFVSAMTLDLLVYFDSDPDSGYSLDNIPPLPIQDLEIDPNSWFTLEWTVPGEYVGEQPISAYDIRYSPVPVGADTQAWWDTAYACAGEGFFNFIVGETDSFRVAKESWCHPECYFAIKGLDSRPNVSGISNIIRFICGDVNADGVVELGDVVKLISYLYRGGPPPEPLASGDVTCDGVVDLGDVVYLISYLYRGGPPPCGS